MPEAGQQFQTGASQTDNVDVTSGSYWVNVTARTSKGTVESFCQGVNLQDKNYIAINGITMNKHSHSVDLNVNYTSGDTNMNFMWQTTTCQPTPGQPFLTGRHRHQANLERIKRFLLGKRYSKKWRRKNSFLL